MEYTYHSWPVQATKHLGSKGQHEIVLTTVGSWNPQWVSAPQRICPQRRCSNDAAQTIKMAAGCGAPTGSGACGTESCSAWVAEQGRGRMGAQDTAAQARNPTTPEARAPCSLQNTRLNEHRKVMQSRDASVIVCMRMLLAGHGLLITETPF